MKSVMISIQPKWCELIASGKKTVEVRKTQPKMQTPFKVYIYCTKGQTIWTGNVEDYGTLTTIGNGKVIGEFVCDKIFDICIEISKPDDLPGYPFPCTGLTDKEILQYLGNGKTGYGWHISNLVIYDEPKPLSNYLRCPYPWECEACDLFDGFDISCNRKIRPPQSWCYVEG